MKLEEIRTIAKEKGVTSGRLSKKDLIRTIQKTEGNLECFGTAQDNCPQENCLWRDDCLKKKS